LLAFIRLHCSHLFSAPLALPLLQRSWAQSNQTANFFDRKSILRNIHAPSVLETANKCLRVNTEGLKYEPKKQANSRLKMNK